MSDFLSRPDTVSQPYNLILAQKHQALRGAQRFALATTCNPATGAPLPATSKQLRNQLRHVPIVATATGSNILIPGSSGPINVYEFVLWNVTQQTLILRQGGILLLELTDFPDLAGLTLGFNGNFDQPHWTIDTSQALTLDLQNGTRVTGFIRYTVQQGS